MVASWSRILINHSNSRICRCCNGPFPFCSNDARYKCCKKNSSVKKYLPLGIAVFIAFNALIIYFFINTFENIDYNAVRNIEIISDSNTENLGYLLFTKYIIEFEIAGLILLLGIISAIVLTYRKNPKNKYQNPIKQISASKKDRLKIITDLKE